MTGGGYRRLSGNRYQGLPLLPGTSVSSTRGRGNGSRRRIVPWSPKARKKGIGTEGDVAFQGDVRSVVRGESLPCQGPETSNW